MLNSSPFLKLLDLIWPRVCPICHQQSNRKNRIICWNCLNFLEILSPEIPHCTRCGIRFQGAVSGEVLCPTCSEHPPHFDAARSAILYRGEARNLIHLFKYNQQLWMLTDFWDILEACARTCFNIHDFDAIIPVPLHSAKLLLRHFNQSELLSHGLAKRLSIPHSPNLLKRNRDTPTQTLLGIEGRRNNVRSAFEVPHPDLIRGRTILLIDDVMTTGATLSELSAILKDAGAWRVFCLTLARAQK